MRGAKTLDSYRRMTAGERIAVACELIRKNTPYLLAGRSDGVDRRAGVIGRPPLH